MRSIHLVSTKPARVRCDRKYRIGNETLHDQAWDITERVWGILCNNVETKSKLVPIVSLQPQQGKTEVMIALTDHFVRYCQARGLTYQVIVISALSHCDLRDQTRARLTYDVVDRDGRSVQVGAKLQTLADSGDNRLPSPGGIMIENGTPKLPKTFATLPRDVDMRLIMIDEIHYGNGAFGNIDKALRVVGIKIGENMRAWFQGETRNHVVGVSATAFAHACLSRFDSSDQINLDDNSLFQTITVEPGAEYNSIKRMLDNGRIQEFTEFFGKEGLTATGKQSLKSSAHKYTVVRAPKGKYRDSIEQFISDNRLVSREFDSDHQNISQLNAILEQKPDTHTIVLIKGACRAGITLSETSYIACWVEQNSVNSDTGAQAGPGRACGWGKTEDTYKIFCNKRALEKVAAYYDAILTDGKAIVIPSGRQNRKKEISRQSRTVEQVVSLEQGKEIVRGRTGGSLQGARVFTSTYGRRDSVKGLLDGNYEITGKCEAVIFDGPYSGKNGKNYDASWERLTNEHPEWVGKCVILSRDKSLVKVNHNPDHQQKKTSALNPDSVIVH